MKGIRLMGLLVLSVFLVSCATVSDTAKYYLDKPINCNTATTDIATLESEKASDSERTMAGVRAVVPSAAVIGMIRKDWSNRKEVASGEYNQAIDDKIVEIQRACNIY
jgi:hypothetical protein